MCFQRKIMFFFVFVKRANAFCWISSIYAIRWKIVCNNRINTDYDIVSYSGVAQHDRACANEHIVPNADNPDFCVRFCKESTGIMCQELYAC